MVADRVFWKSLCNTVLYVAFVVPVSVGTRSRRCAADRGRHQPARLLSRRLFPARDLDADRHGDGVAVHAPSQHRPRQPDRRALGLPSTNWLKNPDLALFALAVIGIWQALGLNMVLLLAGLKSIPRDLYEAAAIDGADGAVGAVPSP